jgi:polyhydroxyalkanoate synthase
MVPSMLQRWQILDLLPEQSLVEACLAQGLEVFVVDWGELGDERLLTFDETIARLERFARRARRHLGGRPLGLLGYSQGGTLATVLAARAPAHFERLVTVAAPIDFAIGGVLTPLTDARLLNADQLADAGGVPAQAFRAMVAMMHPGTTALSVLASWAHPDPTVRRSFSALERWADDSVPLPPEVTRVWLRRFLQDNALIRGTLSVAGRRVALSDLTLPSLVVVADGDTLCPPASALALLDHIGTAPPQRERLRVPGGHVSGIAGPGSAERVHRPIARWLDA